MKRGLPEEITEAVDILEKIESNNNPEKIGEFFKEGIESLNVCVDDFPDYKDKIWNYKFTYTKKLVERLIKDIDLVATLDIGYFVLLLGLVTKEEIISVFKIYPIMEESLRELVCSYPNGGEVIWKGFLEILNTDK